ncbi:hypothetical protein HXX76_011353 [Chlamydomonas incerta]|uniref:Glycosyltransferase family 92 protein n=1 Tax=Chlamydomonas incerta TaxID=51695 RepID=A0A835SK83_CHLIN|nr:hypothetical protein HXX76_011353 [Chlamydomonas incerta]|eukprot:KAG2428648.1 hypothetical protein HXX76_011353 [Chlamydomonas incerta]
MLPSQIHAVDGFAWVEDIRNISSSLYGCLFSQVNPHVWQPRLRLDTTSGHTIASTPIPTGLDHPWSHLRPFHFTFPLPAAHESDFCFKVWEASFPDNKAPFCLPPSSAALCHRLAPSATYTPDRPALWSVLIPFRSMGTPWATHVADSANRLYYHMAYLKDIGAAGLLLFTDPLTSQALEATPPVQRFLREGRLVLVSWEQMERSTYQYDHVWVYSAATLGLSGCGTNVWLLLNDLDEMLTSVSRYAPSWPDMYNCLVRSANDPAAGVFRLRRVDVVTSFVNASSEWALWTTPPGGDMAAAGGVAALPAGAGGGVSTDLPLTLYDRIARKPFSIYTGKMVVCPARRIVDIWVHNARALNGSWFEGNASCAFMVHVVNFWKERDSNPDAYEPFLLLKTPRKKALRSAGASGRAAGAAAARG